MRTFIIAEAGVNHNGSIKTAKEMIDAAVFAGADAVKFQAFKAELLATKTAPCAKYQKIQINEGESQFLMLKRLELDNNDMRTLMEYSKKKRVTFLASPFDCENIDFLHKCGTGIFKIPSGEITNYPYLVKIGRLSKKIILSTGMSFINEIDAALSLLIKSGTKKENITLLHCNTAYPTPIEDVNLQAMVTMKEEFRVPVGYSDHTMGIEVSIAACALGAEIIEKHFTLNRNMKGPDHKASLEPEELKRMVDAIRNIEKALGDGKKKVSSSECANKEIARKSIVAVTKIQKGESFTEENITTKRPGNGISPMDWEKVKKRVAAKNFEADDLISY